MNRINTLKLEITLLKNRVEKLELFVNKQEADTWNKENPQKYFPGDKVKVSYINSAGEEEYISDCIVVDYRPARGNYPYGYYLVDRNGKIIEAAYNELHLWGYAIKK